MLLLVGAVYSVVVFAVNAFLTIPFSSWLARRLGAIDQPGEHKIHAQPTPRLGGVGIIIGFILAVSLLVPLLAIFDTLDISTLLNSQLIICFSLLLAIATVGILDDIYNQKAWVKFILEGIIATILIFTLGGFHGWIIAIIAWFAIVGLINGYNFLDGIDGLAAGVAIVHLMTLAALFALTSNQLLAIVAMTLAIATLGFLRYNWPPASIFMGDTGSLSLGFVISALSLMLVIQENFSARSILAVILAASLPLGDLSLTFLRRLLSGKPLFSADRGHYYDQMTITGGISKLDTMRLSILIALSVGILSVSAFTLPTSLNLYPFVIGALILMLATRYFKISLQ